MKLLFSTASVHPRDRLAYWREEATKAFVGYEFASTTNGLIFKVPRSKLEARLGNIARYTALNLSPSQPVAALASDFLAKLAEHAHAIDQSSAASLAQQALDLVALGFESMGAGRAQLRRSARLPCCA